jgi:glycosyltransferase involved in cell wall biosynthesis
MSGNGIRASTELSNLGGGLVSVLINCFNGERYLKEAIDSVFAQTYENWEIVFWDNASTDRSADIALSYGKRVRYYRAKTTSNLGTARNLAMKEARGEFVAFLDCDDVWLPEKLTIQVSEMSSDAYALNYGGIVNINASGNTISRYIPKQKVGNLFEVLLKQFDINVPTALLRLATLKQLNLEFDENIHASEEYCLFMQLAARAKISVTPQVLAKYRVMPESLTNGKIEKWADEREYTLKLIMRNNPGIEHRYARGFREAFARAKYYRARLFMHRGNRGAARTELRPIMFVGWRYFGLFAILFLPGVLWEHLHKQLPSSRDV